MTKISVILILVIYFVTNKKIYANESNNFPSDVDPHQDPYAPAARYYPTTYRRPSRPRPHPRPRPPSHHTQHHVNWNIDIPWPNFQPSDEQPANPYNAAYSQTSYWGRGTATDPKFKNNNNYFVQNNKAGPTMLRGDAVPADEGSFNTLQLGEGSSVHSTSYKSQSNTVLKKDQ